MKKLAVLLCLVASAASAQEFTVGQKDKAFTVPALKAKVGDVVSFKNEDAFFHNVYSLSDAATFDLGSYPQGEARSVTLEKAGTVEVECAIHPSMKMTIEVE